MHEVSLCQRLIGILEAEGRAQGFGRVRVVRLEVGELSCVEPEALRFAFEASRGGTIAAGATLEIRTVPAGAWCVACGATRTVTRTLWRCPACGGDDLLPEGGSELRIADVEVW